MANTLRTGPIATWQPGDAVQGFALVRRRDLRQDKSGRDYLDLELADASGTIPAKAWSDSAALTQEFAAHDFVKFRGQVQSYKDQLQLKLDNCRRVVEADRRDGFDEALLVPTTREDIDQLWQRLEGLLEAVNSHRDDYCTSCYTGRYPLPFPREEAQLLQVDRGVGKE